MFNNVWAIYFDFETWQRNDTTHFFCGLAAAGLVAAATALAGAALTGAAFTGAALTTAGLGTFATLSPAGFGLRTLCFLENFKFLKNFGSTYFFSEWKNFFLLKNF